MQNAPAARGARISRAYNAPNVGLRAEIRTPTRKALYGKNLRVRDCQSRQAPIG